MSGRLWILAVISAAYVATQARAEHPAAKSSNEFCFVMMDHMSQPSANLVFSPFSVWSQLTLLAAGAEGETRQQMHKVLALEAMFPKPEPQDDAGVPALPSGDPNSLAAEWLDQMKAARGMSMKPLNQIWAHSGLTFLPVFENLAARTFGAVIEPLDFSGDADGSARRINAWAAGSTGGVVKEMLAPGAIRPDTRIIVASAFGFDGKWAAPFDARQTMKRDFTKADGRKALVETMSGEVAAGFFEDHRLQALRLRFQDAAASLIVVVPKNQQASGGRPLLRDHDFIPLVSMMRNEPRVAVRLPRFRLSMSMDVSASLRAAGMMRIFGKTAELARLCDRPALISGVMHSAAITVRESGAASDRGAEVKPVSAASGGDGAARRAFVADRPFHFFVFDESFNGILLAGTVADPAE